MGKYMIDWEQYAAAARKAAAEGAVLLRNENQALPLMKGEKVSVFGRIQTNYYKSGTGSGGAVHTRYVVSILDAMKNCDSLSLNEKVLNTYQEWEMTHPFDQGVGWAGEPWCQEEMKLEESFVEEAAKDSDAAVVIIGRTAGEDKDNSTEAGSYLLSDIENDLLKKVCCAFQRVIVVLNVANIIDMKWVEEWKPQAVLYTWQGGQEGGNAVVDVLTGRVNPCGHLTDTIARDISDYPSTANFGDPQKVVYREDIYIGYRYFQTFAPEKVLYPFGYGLSYTEFKMTAIDTIFDGSIVKISIEVENTGIRAGKHVAQVYLKKPQGKLGQPERVLAGFEKTDCLVPGEKQTLNVEIPVSVMATYDDSGVTGFPYAWVMEAGTYEFYLGENVRDASDIYVLTFSETNLVEQCRQALAPVESYKRMRNVDGAIGYEEVPVRTYSLQERMAVDSWRTVGTDFAGTNVTSSEVCASYTRDQGYRLGDVHDGKISMQEFLAQLSDEDLSHLAKGEGMCSPKVTPGTASACGGLTERLQKFGIPAICCADGPSGIRMDCGTIAFSLPNGTCLASTFDRKVNEELFAWEGLEMRKNRVDTLLGPGINLHRNPLNGRNFEYFSEDPLLTGQIAAAQLKGLGTWGVTGTIKHFTCNNQETGRFSSNSVVSERALRELYLKSFEIAVKEGGAFSIMSSYNAVNGIWTAGNYDLLTTILRNEWGYTGMVMTDWWASANEEGKEAKRGGNLHAMVRAQNDIYMVVPDTKTYDDDILASLEAGVITRGELLRNAANICNVAMRLPCMDWLLDRISEEEKKDMEQQREEDGMPLSMEYQDVLTDPGLMVEGMDTSAGTRIVFGIMAEKISVFNLTFEAKVDAGGLAQVPLTIHLDSAVLETYTLNGTNGEWVPLHHDKIVIISPYHYVSLFFAQTGMQIRNMKLELVRTFTNEEFQQILAEHAQ